MISKLRLAFVFLLTGLGSCQGIGFTFNGFRSANLDLEGIAEFTPTGLLRLTNATKQMAGYAFYPSPITFKNSSEGSTFSFSTTFVFGISSKLLTVSGHGIAFVVAPQRGLPGAFASQYLGLFNDTNNGNATNHVFAVELDTLQNAEFNDINDNHVGIDINGLESVEAYPAGYYPYGGTGKFENLSLMSGSPMQVWVDYTDTDKRIDVTLAPFEAARPSTPLLSLSRDLSPIINNTMYVGFSSATGSVDTSYYILGWSFQMNGQAQELDLPNLPKLPRVRKQPTSKLLTIGAPTLCIFFAAVFITGSVDYARKKRKFAEILEEWELPYGPHRFKYKDLHIATGGFRDDELLGSGGFGKVYRGTLPSSKIEIAVKRVAHDSRQGIREFVAEIVSIGQLRHRNLVTLLGYCRQRKGELLLVYDYMPNGSLDKYLFDQPSVTLNWTQRFKVITGVASGLLYLHEGWDQVVIHRDVKASNVLLDAELNGRLGDFGLAKLYDRGTDPQTTKVVGTFGYLAPEYIRTGKATKATDVFAFGAFLLEVVTGRRPIETRGTECVILVDWVFSSWSRGGEEILEVSDPNLRGEFVVQEFELVLKLGLLCSHSDPEARPTIRQVVQCLEGDLAIQDLSSSLNVSPGGLGASQEAGSGDFVRTSSFSSSIADSLLSGGR